MYSICGGLIESMGCFIQNLYLRKGISLSYVPQEIKAFSVRILQISWGMLQTP